MLTLWFVIFYYETCSSNVSLEIISTYVNNLSTVQLNETRKILNEFVLIAFPKDRSHTLQNILRVLAKPIFCSWDILDLKEIAADDKKHAHMKIHYLKIRTLILAKTSGIFYGVRDLSFRQEFFNSIFRWISTDRSKIHSWPIDPGHKSAKDFSLSDWVLLIRKIWSPTFGCVPSLLVNN